MKNILNNEILDRLGFSASFLCAVHCAAMPLALTAISATPFGFLANPLFEISIILLSIFIGISSLLPAYLKQHKKFSPIAILLLGFSLIFSGHFLVPEDLESVVTPVGAMLVALAHIMNYKFSREDSFECCLETHA